MIEIKATGMCDGCEDMRLELNEMEFSAFRESEYHYDLVCVHRHVCEKYEKKLRSIEGKVNAKEHV